MVKNAPHLEYTKSGKNIDFHEILFLKLPLFHNKSDRELRRQKKIRFIISFDNKSIIVTHKDESFIKWSFFDSEWKE